MKERLLLADVRALENPEYYAAAWAAVGASRREKTDRLRQPADRYRSLCAGLLLRHASRGVLPADAEPVCAAGGKPFYAEAPEFCFNLSHSGDFAVCAVSDRDVGCDIEKIGEASLSVARRFFLPDEAAAIEACADAKARDRLFFRYWTLKESFLKVTGRGLGLPLDAFGIRFPDGVPEIVQKEDSRAFFCTEYAVPEGYALAVCRAEGRFAASAELWSVPDLLRD